MFLQRYSILRTKIMQGLATVLADPRFPRIGNRAIATAGMCNIGDISPNFSSRTRMFELLMAYTTESIESITQQVVERTPPGPVRRGRIAAGMCQFFAKNPGCAALMLACSVREMPDRYYGAIAAFWYDLPAAIGPLYADIVAGRVAFYVASGFRRRPDDNIDAVFTALESIEQEKLW